MIETFMIALIGATAGVAAANLRVSASVRPLTRRRKFSVAVVHGDGMSDEFSSRMFAGDARSAGYRSLVRVPYEGVLPRDLDAIVLWSPGPQRVTDIVDRVRDRYPGTPIVVLDRAGNVSLGTGDNLLIVYDTPRLMSVLASLSEVS